jgi:hypothetical protein
MGTFDPQQFLDQQFTEANSTQYIPIPEKDYTLLSTDVKARPWTSKDQTMSGIALDITYEVDDPELKELLGRDKVTVRQGVMLDLNPGGGISTEKGRNVQLGRVREAMGLNVPGQPFNFRMMVGQVVQGHIKPRVEGDQIYNDVTAVAPRK